MYKTGAKKKKIAYFIAVCYTIIVYFCFPVI